MNCVDSQVSQASLCSQKLSIFTVFEIAPVVTLQHDRSFVTPLLNYFTLRVALRHKNLSECEENLCFSHIFRDMKACIRIEWFKRYLALFFFAN